MINSPEELKRSLELEVAEAYDLVFSLEETRRSLLTNLDDNIDHALVSDGPMRVLNNVMLVESFKRHDLHYVNQKKIVELLSRKIDIFNISDCDPSSELRQTIEDLAGEVDGLARYTLRLIESTRTLLAEYISCENYLDPAFMSYFPDETLLPHIEEVAESSPYDSSNYSLVSDTIH